MKTMILYRKAFIRMTKNNLTDSYLPLIQYAEEDRDGHVGRKKWTVLQGPYSNFLFTKSEYQTTVLQHYKEEAAAGRLYKAKDNPFLESEVESWLMAGFSHSCTLDEYQNVGNQLKAYLDGKMMPIFQEYQLQKYIRDLEFYRSLDYGFWNVDFYTPQAQKRGSGKNSSTAVKQKELSSTFYVLASNCGYWKNYYCRLLKSGIRKDSSVSNLVKRFKTEAEALRFIAHNEVRIKNGYYKWYPLQITN